MKVNIDFRKSVEQNAQAYFEKAKKQRKKLEGAKKALLVSLKKLEDEKVRGEKALDQAKEQLAEKKKKVSKKKEWFENFRWFFSSEGFLVIGGRDATTNEIIIKKYTDKEDIVFHTDMAGSPFFVIKVKDNDRSPSEQTLQETADATLVFSRAWKLGLSTTATFWVTPEQVTKEANAGEFLPKGAFMIRGKTNYIYCSPNCAIGPIKDGHESGLGGKLMCGPTAAVKTNCEEFVEIIQGRSKPSDIAKLIRKRFGHDSGDLDEIIRLLPAGNMDIKQ